MMYAALSIAALLISTVHGDSARPIGCNRKLDIVSISTPNTFTGDLEWLTDGETYNQYQEVISSDWTWNLNIELSRLERVCALSYHTEWWAQCPSHGTISFSTDGGASYTPKADYVGDFSRVLIGTAPTPEYINTFGLDGTGATFVQLSVNGSHSAEARLREISVYTYD